MPPYGPDVDEDILRAQLYQLGRDLVEEAVVRDGLHPDALRCFIDLMELDIGPIAWRGIEDALAGRPADPWRGDRPPDPSDIV